ncbi:Sensor protein CreC [Raoultella planticola]|uniref:histidine kinase n=1 Tax=Raoultella planticola TaxID=575 RepID=A0A485CBU7_RAOPL|nr:Sensor protein CreC [Raoultella planticola]
MQNSCFSRITQARSKNIDLGYEGERSAVMIAGDGVLLAELCANLLDNAIRYTPANGTVTLSLRRDGEGVVMEVEDSGPGIEMTRFSRRCCHFSAWKMSGITPVRVSGWRW